MAVLGPREIMNGTNGRTTQDLLLHIRSNPVISVADPGKQAVHPGTQIVRFALSGSNLLPADAVYISINELYIHILSGEFV